jgi:glucosamine--fructose-6-phosphate aminotransferase (isomerizing)
MCGIVAYIGEKNTWDIIISGLRRLEYRGYDSSGVAIFEQNSGIKVWKKKGKVQDLVDFSAEENKSGFVGIGHTRWATHGEPNDQNAHPHLSNSGKIALIHNGIIENWSPLKQMLVENEYSFSSQTDTEVLCNLIEWVKISENLTIEDAIRVALTKVIGAYAIVVMDSDSPGKLVAARKSSPLVLGLGETDFFLASDATPIIEWTKDVVYINDEEIVVIEDGKFIIKNIDNEIQTPFIKTLDMKIEAIEKGGWDHYMLKEIHQQATTISDALRGRINYSNGEITLGGLAEIADKMENFNRIIIVACGTSWISGLIGEYLIEDLARFNVEVEYASEFRYRNPIIGEKDLVIAISQSGETADTIAALELAKKSGATIYGICNVVGSSIARMTDAGSYIHAGPEIGVASTKAFTGQVAILTLFALQLAKKMGTITEDYLMKIVEDLGKLSEKVESVLKSDEKVKEIAKFWKDSQNSLYLGRGYNFPVALEGALKLKEISYIHAEGYPAAEMKHGPIALIDENMPVVFIATGDSTREKVMSNIQEVKARGGKILAIINKGDDEIKGMVNWTLEIPEIAEPISPLLSVIPLQLLSYYIAVERGCNVDQPRNLAKSVTVE